MLTQVFATKRKMTQAWTKEGKRLAVTCLNVANNVIVGEKAAVEKQSPTFEIGYGTKKLKNMSKPLRSKVEKSGFSLGVQHIQEVSKPEGDDVKVGDSLKVEAVFQVGDVVKVQGTTKGRGFAGAIKRHGFSGGPKTHGQSDRWRAVGAIGQRTTPGRVFKGKKMPGHYGTDVQTVFGLVVLHIDPQTQELWLSGPVPGHINATVRIEKMGLTKTIDIDQKASGIVLPASATADRSAQADKAAAPEVSSTEAPVAEVAPEEGQANAT
jgi:large subunit ribosomal protein L3